MVSGLFPDGPLNGLVHQLVKRNDASIPESSELVDCMLL
jgi:hypothetical protein